MTFIKINGTEYLTNYINGLMHDEEWDARESKSITLPMTYSQADALFQDGTAWSIVERDLGLDEMGVETEFVNEFDNADFNLVGFIRDNRDGTVTVKMGKLTDLEEAYTLLFGEV